MPNVDSLVFLILTPPNKRKEGVKIRMRIRDTDYWGAAHLAAAAGSRLGAAEAELAWLAAEAGACTGRRIVRSAAEGGRSVRGKQGSIASQPAPSVGWQAGRQGTAASLAPTGRRPTSTPASCLCV